MKQPDSNGLQTSRPIISVRFAAIVVVLGVLAYFLVPQVMTYTMYLMEKSKAEGPPEFKTPSKERPPAPSAISE